MTRVRIQGSRTAPSAFASINRRWTEVLTRRADVSLVTDDDSRADVVIHHDFAVRFGEATLMPGRHRVAVRPWDFGRYPERWVHVVRTQYDELWVHSRALAAHARAAGLDDHRVRLVPLGVDPSVMTPVGPRHIAGINGEFVFAFVGAAVHRKGIDLLLKAFTSAFTARDAVALVVKDHTGDVFYRGQSYRDRILEMAAADGAPRMVYIDDYLPATDLAALYRRADAIVLPSRSEGFACPVLEAMACGTPAIVPDFGACTDYCDGSTGLLVRSRRISLPIGRTMTTNSRGYDEFVDSVDFAETRVDHLVDAMRALVAMSATDRSRLGRNAAERARTWTWEASVDAMGLDRFSPDGALDAHR